MEQAMDAWYAFVWQFVGTRLPSGGGRKEVCQAVFRVVGRKWLTHQVRDNSTGAALLDMSEAQQRASLVNVCLKECANYFRNQREHDASHVSLHDMPDGDAPRLTTPGDALDVIIADETREEIARLIETRKPAEAQIGREALLEGFTVDEIAERHGIQTTSVATIVSRVRRFLRVALGRPV
jgi:DNA-directed RNA polymerase specialized sigma24 family protein